MWCTSESPNACNAGPLGPSLADACSAPEFLVFMSLLNTLVKSKEKISGACERVKSVKKPDKVYDFVVVGGGAAGSVIASRLSEIPHWKVLLLEAGPDEPAGSEIPSFASKFLETDITWNYKTSNESDACLATNGSCAWPSGKNLGGNTAHNGMLYIRGNPTDYDDWAALGNEGWSWEEVKPFFLKSEDNREVDRVGKENHGTGGPLPVERFRYLPPFGNTILKASIEAGYGVSEDFNGEKRTGFSVAQATNKNGVRHSTSRAFLWPARNRRNLHVSLDSLVTRVMVQDEKAVGVEYRNKDGELKRVYVTREVILSGGAVESPHVLLLSGIGSREHLESVGVKVVKELPGVGENLHDHPGTAMTFTMNGPDVYDNDWAAATRYHDFQDGPLSAIGTSQVLGVLASNATGPDDPDIAIYIASYFPNCAPGGIGALRSTGDRSVLVVSSYLHPKSRGRVTLASKNPFKQPVIWANYLGHPDDLERVVDGVKIVLKLISTEAFREYNVTLSESPVQVCSNHQFLSDEYWACAVRQNNYPLYHQGGTCKMGPKSDPMAVVDPRLRVHGIKGLRVADGSIMPRVISGNTAAPIMMIGERAAHFIKEDWGCRS